MDTSQILLSLHKILQYVPHLGILSSILLMTLLAISGNWLLLSYAVMLLIPVIMVSIIFLWKKQSLQISLPELADNCLFDFNIRAQTFCKIYVILLLLTLAWILFANSRDWLFLLLIVLMYSVSIVQLFSKTLKSKWVVLQLTLTSLIVVLTKQFCYYYYYNTGDSIGHALYVLMYIRSGGIPTTDLISGYAEFFQFHIESAITALLTGVAPISATYIAAVIPIIVGVVFVYYIALSLTNSERTAAIASLCYLLTPVVLNYACRSAPRTMATLAFLIILYFFLQRKEWSSLKVWGCTALFALYMIMVHHAQLPLIIAVMTGIILSYWICYRQLSKNQIGVVILFYLIPFIYYIYTYLGIMIGILNRQFFGVFGSVELTETSEIVSETVQLSTYLNLSAGIFMLVTILFGIFYLIQPQNIHKKAIIFLPLTLILFPIFIPGVADASALLSSMEQITRLQIVLAPVFAVVMGIGSIILFNLINTMTKSRKTAVIFLIIFLLLFVISSAVIYNSKDSTPFENTELSEKKYFNEDEIAMYTNINTYVLPTSEIYSEYSVSRYFPTSASYQYMDMAYYTFPLGMHTLFTSEPEYRVDTYVIFREQEYFNRGLTIKIGKGAYAAKAERVYFDDESNTYFQKNTFNFESVYNNGASKLLYYP